MQTIRPATLCETCGSSLDIEAPSGFCPACLLTTALREDADLTQSAASGSRIEDYELLNEVARGGMGIVYRARQRAPSRIVALKMILPAHLSSSGAMDRFCAEAEAAASLDHEGILPIYAVGEHDGAPFYSMKFAEGGTLRARLSDYRDKLREGAALIAQIARAVAHAHEHGILHRDLKPDNILFDAAGKGYVSDFGLAKWLEREGDLTQTLAILGTPFYMAPEQASGARHLTPAADVYSLGAILFHLLTGRVPFRGDNALDVLRQAAERPAPRPRALNNKVPADLETICLKCLEKNPTARYSSAAALADDLDRLLARRAIHARRANPITHAVRWARRNPSIALLGAASAALLVSLLLVMRPAASRKAEDPGKSIAVLPFENLSDNKDDALMLRGIQEDLLVSLSKIGDLKVISRGSVMRYQENVRDLRAIGNTLGVNAVLEGSFRRRGDHSELNVQLINPAKGEQIWAETYEHATADLFILQRDLATRIAFALKARVTSRETTRLQRRPTQNAEAYLFYLQANDVFHAYGREHGDLKRAEELLEKAIALDPSFALAFAQLSQVETVLHSSHDPATARRARAKAAADEAIRLQPDLPEAHLALGRYYWIDENPSGEADYAQAMRELSIAQRGLPNDPEVYSNIGRLERHLGKWSDSTMHLARAVALDPNNEERWHRLFFNYELTRNYPAASQALDRVIALAPDTWSYQVHRGYLDLFWKGATTALEDILTRPPSGDGPEGFVIVWRFYAALLLRKYEEAERMLLEDSRESFTRGWLQPIPKSFMLGQLYYRTKDIAKARASFEKARPSIEQTVEQRPLEGAWHLVLAEVYAGLGRKEDAIREAKRATGITPESKDPWAGLSMLDGLAEIYFMVGERELAIPIIEHSLGSPGGMYLEQLRISPFWEPLRDNPRFQKLLGPAPTQSAISKSIAVLPFENLSEDKSNDYLASGIHDEVLVDLSKIADLKVISRNSVQAYKDGPRDLREIGRTLGVRTVLQGNVRRAGTRARINVQLIDTRNEAQIWAESFDREVTDVLSVEGELALRIAAALQTKLSPAEKAAIEALPTRDPEAYDLYLRARESVYSIRTRDDSSVDIHRAIELLNQAVGRDPNFALAYSFLAQMHLSDFESNGEAAQLERARICLETALRLAPDLGEAHLARGIYFNYGLRDYESARAEFAIARSALPNNAECLHWSGLLERRVGHWKEGLHYQLKAATLDPRDGMVQRDLLVTYCLLRNYAEAERTIERAIIVSPQQTSFFRMKQAEVALMKGDLAACRTALQSLPSDFEFNGFVAYLRARLAFFERDYAQTARILEDALNKLGRPKAEWWVLRDRAFLARAEGDRNKTQAAWESLRKFWEAKLAAKPDDWQLLSWIAAADAALGRKEEAKRGMEKSVQHSLANDAEDGPTLAMTEALVHAWCGDHERALVQLAELAKKPAGPKPGDLKFDPRWDDLRGNARFQEIVAAAAQPIKVD